MSDEVDRFARWLAWWSNPGVNIDVNIALPLGALPFQVRTPHGLTHVVGDSTPLWTAYRQMASDILEHLAKGDGE